MSKEYETVPKDESAEVETPEESTEVSDDGPPKKRSCCDACRQVSAVPSSLTRRRATPGTPVPPTRDRFGAAHA